MVEFVNDVDIYESRSEGYIGLIDIDGELFFFIGNFGEFEDFVDVEGDDVGVYSLFKDVECEEDIIVVQV